MESLATISSPPVILQNGTVGTSTIYTNNTSAKVSVEAPLFDYVDNNDPDVDSNVDKGMHSDFPAQQAGPDTTYDTLSEENTEAIEVYVDNNTSDEDGSSDIGIHNNFGNQKAQDSSYDTLTEQNTAAGITKVGTDSSGTGTNLTLSFSHTLVSGTARIVIVSIGVENGDTIDVSTVTYGGVTMTLAVEGITDTSPFSFLAEIWYILENDLPSDGSQNVEITCSGTAYELEVNGFCSEYAGVTQGAPEATAEHNQTTGTTISNDISPSDNAWVISVVGAGNTGTFTHGQSQVEVLDFLDTSSTFAVAELRGASGETSLDSTFSGTVNRLERVTASWTDATEDNNYELDLEIQFTDVIDFLPTETLCIHTGAFSGTEDINVDFWNSTGWENLATDLNAYSCNEYTVSLTSTNFTIRFKDGATVGDTTQDQWQIDASLLRVEGAGNKEDAVDNDTSNVDGSDDVGTLSNFDNMKTKDGMTNLTEGEVAGGTVWLWQEDTSGYTSTSSYETFEFWNSWTTNSTTSGTVTKIGIYVFADPGNSPQVKLGIYDDSGGSPNNLLGETNATTITGAGWLDLDIVGGGVSISASTTYHLAHITDVAPTTQWRYYKTATPVSDYRGSRVWPNLFDPAGTTTKSSSYRYGAYRVGYDEPSDYRLDQEVQWTDLPYSLPNEELCIYAGAVGTEDVRVDVWNSSSWVNVISDLNSSDWNNVTITSYLTSGTFTIRFRGGNETGDTNPDTWQIDVALIHLWYDSGETYQLDLEVQWTGADYTRANEELCIRTGTFSGSENIQVKAWNTTGSSWHWVMNLTANQWNNVSVTSYLTSSTFTVQFLGGTETGDISQDSWNLDATLLHVWTQEWGTWSDELLVNPSFEMGNLTGWTTKGPAAASVEVFNATSGGDIYTNRSLRIGDYGVCTLDTPGTNDDSGVWQNVSLSSYASAIDSGNAVINATAWLYPSEWDWDDVALIVRFYNSSGGFLSAWNTTGEYGSGSAYYPQAWMLGQGEVHFTQGQLEKFGCYNYTIPVGARIVGIQLGMGEHKDTFYCGGQADEASIKVRTFALASYDYVLRVNNTETSSWQIRLKEHSDSNINRLENCTIYFHNSTDGTSNQIVIENGGYTQDVGPWYDLGNSETIYLAMTTQSNSAGTSYIYVCLEVLTIGTTTYAQYVITFEVN